MPTILPGLFASPADVTANQVTFVSFPDGFVIGPPEPIDFSSPFPSINYPPEIGVDYYDYLFANVDGALTFAPTIHAANYAVCYYIQRPWTDSGGAGGGSTPWCVFVYDAITGAYMNPSAPLLTAQPSGAAAVGAYPVAHPGTSIPPPSVNCLRAVPESGGRFDLSVIVTAARTGDTDKPASPQPFTTYTPSFSWFVMPFGSFTDYKIGPPSAPNAPLGGSITLNGNAGGIVIAAYSLTAQLDCATLYNELTGLLKFKTQLQAEINAAIAGNPLSSWPTTVWPLEAQMSTLNAQIAALEAQLNQLGCPGYTA